MAAGYIFLLNRAKVWQHSPCRRIDTMWREQENRYQMWLSRRVTKREGSLSGPKRLVTRFDATIKHTASGGRTSSGLGSRISALCDISFGPTFQRAVSAQFHPITGDPRAGQVKFEVRPSTPTPKIQNYTITQDGRSNMDFSQA